MGPSVLVSEQSQIKTYTLHTKRDQMTNVGVDSEVLGARIVDNVGFVITPPKVCAHL